MYEFGYDDFLNFRYPYLLQIHMTYMKPWRKSQFLFLVIVILGATDTHHSPMQGGEINEIHSYVYALKYFVLQDFDSTTADLKNVILNYHIVLAPSVHLC